ncbi:MAG: flavin reductase family protein [Planctomycetota bacterium]|nr:flavin reductase family protein [Planctomycetota bacterium]
MPTLDPDKLSKLQRHQLMIGSIVPRPIAWVTTLGETGVVNLAPFSYFMGVGSSPPTLAISIGARTPAKDTLVNLRQRGEGVVHIVPPDHMDTVNQTGAEYPSDVSEVEQLGLETIPSVRIKPPRLAVAEVALESRLIHEVHVGSPGSTICVLEVLLAHVSDEVARDDGLPDPRKLRGIARLGERFYLAAHDWAIEEKELGTVT